MFSDLDEYLGARSLRPTVVAHRDGFEFGPHPPHDILGLPASAYGFADLADRGEEFLEIADLHIQHADACSLQHLGNFRPFNAGGNHQVGVEG